MKSFLYIGQNTRGTTSAMRCEYLCKILHDWNCSVIDTNAVFLNQPALFKSIAFRFNRGPAVVAINKAIVRQIGDKQYNLVWIDKGVFIKKDTLTFLRRQTKKIVHYTPDTAFVFHKSHLFNEGIGHYDFLITTKSYELNTYYKYVAKEKVILTTQGFDKNVHKPYHHFLEKNGAIMVGLFEPNRGKMVKLLLDNGVKVKVAGAGWEKFVKENSSFPNLNYLGKGLFGEDYAKAISSSLFGLGLLSKKFPERHTTRTFEIPACGTALVTEANDEIKSFYSDDEVIFFNNDDELVERIKFLQHHHDELISITEKGCKKVLHRGFDYDSILHGIVREIV